MTPQQKARSEHIITGLRERERQLETRLAGWEYEALVLLQELAAEPVRVPLTNARIADVGFRFDGEKQLHVPTVLLEFEPVPVNSPEGNTSKGWIDRDAFARAIERAHGISA